MVSEIEKKEVKKPRIHVGCSGYYYKHWIGRFYPEACKSTHFFQHYQTYFSTVEINSTFYHYPTEKQIHSWIEKSNDDFFLQNRLLSLQLPGIKRRLKQEKFQKSFKLMLFGGVIIWIYPVSIFSSSSTSTL